jgi:hypothetical protein
MQHGLENVIFIIVDDQAYKKTMITRLVTPAFHFPEA